MKQQYINLTIFAVAALMALCGCKGRTTSQVEPDGSPEVQVSVPETQNAGVARDSLRAKVRKAANQSSELSGVDSSTQPSDSTSGMESPFMQYNTK